jgi:ferredoxin
LAAVSVIFAENKTRKIAVPADTGLLSALRSAGVYLPAVCGGRGVCGKCQLRVSSGSLPVTVAGGRFLHIP